MSKVEANPLVFITSAELSDYLGREDVVVCECFHDRVEAPQFGISVPFEGEDEAAASAALSRLIRSILAHFDALSELDEAYIHAQERAQLNVLHRAFLPWFARLMAQNPAYYEVPPVDRNAHLSEEQRPFVDG